MGSYKVHRRVAVLDRWVFLWASWFCKEVYIGYMSAEANSICRSPCRLLSVRMDMPRQPRYGCTNHTGICYNCERRVHMDRVPQCQVICRVNSHLVEIERWGQACAWREASRRLVFVLRFRSELSAHLDTPFEA